MPQATTTVTPSVKRVEELTVVEISFYDHEIHAGQKLIASITYDHNDFVTQPWLVMVNGSEIHRATTQARCYRYICTHHKDRTLPEQREETPVATDNEIQCQIANECEKHGFELLEDGIYCSDFKVGEVGFDALWWFLRASSEHQQKVFCSSVADAVKGLAIVESASCEDLLDRPFDQLTDEEWQRLLEYAPVSETNEWVAA
ncbi:MAG: hypothetical protein AB3A66_28695 (plasmid) [Nodularia sp. CChRGM 3473]